MHRFAALLLIGCTSTPALVQDAPAADAATGPGTFSVAWSLTDQHDENLACDRIGARSFVVGIHERTANTSSTEVFACASGAGSFQREAGTYDLTFELTGTTGTLATAPGQQGIELGAAAAVRLAPVELAIVATGGMQLALASGKAGGNCATAALGGAGITATTITLVHASTAACEPVTFEISAGATQPAGTYTVDCANPALGPCIEADQTLTVTGMPSDSYEIHVRGDELAVPCWSNDDQLAVPAGDQYLTRTLNLAQASTPGC